MVLCENLVDSLQKDHQELSDLAVSFQNALTDFDREKVRKILGRIDSVAKAHFEFEENYLYPRMLRLTRQLAEKLSTDRRAINEVIIKTECALRQKRLRKDRLSNLSGISTLLSRHLKDCHDVVILAAKFEEEEKNKLNQKLNECHKRKGIRNCIK